VSSSATIATRLVARVERARPAYPLGALADGRQPGQGVRRVAADVTLWLVVVTYPHTVETDLLGGHSQLNELAWAELPGGTL